MLTPAQTRDYLPGYLPDKIPDVIPDAFYLVVAGVLVGTSLLCFLRHWWVK